AGQGLQAVLQERHGAARAAAAALRAGGAALSHHRRRLHRRAAPLRFRGGGARAMVPPRRLCGGSAPPRPRRLEGAAESIRRGGEKAVPQGKSISQEKEKSMIGLVIVTHGRLAEEFIAVMEHVVGKQEQVAAVCMAPEDDLEQKRQEIIQKIKDVNKGRGVIVLTDM